MPEPKRILIVGVNWLGDALMSTPAVRAVRRAYSTAHLEVLVPPRVQGVFVRNPHVNGVIMYDDRAAIPSPSFWKTVFEVRCRRFDTAILLHGSRTKARLAKWAGIDERWGMAGDDRDDLLTRRAPMSPCGTHRAQIYLDIVNALDIPGDGKCLDFIPDPAAKQSLQALLEAHGINPGLPFAVVHGGGNWELKRWPVAHFRSWIERFVEARPGVPVILSGTSNESLLAQEIAEGMGSRVCVLTGKTSLDELAFLFRQALFVLSNDSGPIHLAASQGARLVGLYGPTSPHQTGPWTESPAEILWKDPGCEIPCYFRSCDLRVCLDRLTPEAVLQSCLRIGDSQ